MIVKQDGVDPGELDSFTVTLADSESRLACAISEWEVKGDLMNAALLAAARMLASLGDGDAKFVVYLHKA